MQIKDSVKSERSDEPVGMSDAQVHEAARLFAMLAEPTRLFLLRALMPGPKSVTDLIVATGLKQGNASKHLGILMAAGFVRRERDGNFAIYEIADPSVHELCDLMCRRIQQHARQRAELLG